MADLDEFRSQNSSDGEGEQKYSIIHSEDLRGSKIKKIPTYQIYRQTLFSRLNLLKGYKIKTLEGNLWLENKPKDIYLLSRDEIREHRSSYKFLHIGLVQVSLSTRSFSFRAKVKIVLRNSKKLDIKESMLAALESELHQGRPMTFNWFPNFSSSLSDLGVSNALAVTVEPYDSSNINATLPFNMKYRVCYKLMETSLKPQSLFESPVLEIDTEKIEVLYQT